MHLRLIGLSLFISLYCGLCAASAGFKKPSEEQSAEGEFPKLLLALQHERSALEGLARRQDYYQAMQSVDAIDGLISKIDGLGLDSSSRDQRARVDALVTVAEFLRSLELRSRALSYYERALLAGKKIEPADQHLYLKIVSGWVQTLLDANIYVDASVAYHYLGSFSQELNAASKSTADKILTSLESLITFLQSVSTRRDDQKITAQVKAERLLEAALAANPATFGNTVSARRNCAAKAYRQSVQRALLIGVSGYQYQKSLEAPPNDVKLIKDSLVVRGVKKSNIVSLVDEAASRDGILSGMADIVDASKCGDFVLLYYSGEAFGPTYWRVKGPLGWEAALFPFDVNARVTEFDTVTPDQFVWGADISAFVTALRRRGANVFILLDTGSSEGLAIQHFQRLAEDSENWKARGEVKTGTLVTKDTERRRLATDSLGDYAVFYASPTHSSGHVLELQLPTEAGEMRPYGAVTYALARALQTLERPTIEELAKNLTTELSNLSTEYASGYYTELAPLVFEASRSDFTFLEAPKPLEDDTLGIEFLAPQLLRGALQVEAPTFDLIGRLHQPHRYAVLTIDHKPVTFDVNGQFKRKVELEDGVNTVTIDAVGYDHRFSTKTIEFTYKGDLEKFANVGKRYALVIGNKDYRNDRAFPDLETPHRDATVVAKLLQKRFGFEMEVETANGERPLLLLDATRRDIERALTDLRRRLTERDSLLVYYAGHGKWLDDNTRAYWIPVDGEADDEFTWLSAADLTDVIKRMSARSVLIVSDSCYSGAFTRAPPDISAFDENRRRALLKAGRRKSRMFISSGGTEPVLDGGGQGHSIFARAFIEALSNVKEPIFSSGELHHLHLVPKVSGKTKQQPERKEIMDSGHDGGDFIFSRIEIAADEERSK